MGSYLLSLLAEALQKLAGAQGRLIFWVLGSVLATENEGSDILRREATVASG